MDVNYTLKGMAELTAKLQDIGGREAINMVRGGVRSGAKVIADEAKRIVPVEHLTDHPGALKKSIRVSSRIKGDDVLVAVKAGNKVAFYAHMVEFGTAPHKIKGPSLLGDQWVENIDHPGARPKPFMRPALDTKLQAAIATLRDYVAKRLEKYQKR